MKIEKAAEISKLVLELNRLEWELAMISNCIVIKDYGDIRLDHELKKKVVDHSVAILHNWYNAEINKLKRKISDFR